MIRYFTYYSCGGYKDIYIGSDKDSASESYLVPLLNMWKKNNKPADAEKIKRAESVQQVELITKNNTAGFPSECDLMFSHGGYNAIYRTLSDGRVCLCIRDIPNVTKDEEGRDIPFNFLFVADGKESIEKLDGLALEYLKRGKEINGLIANAISYDGIVNGVKFDLTKLDALISTNYNNSLMLCHEAGLVDYLIISSRNQESMALKEQGLDAKMIKSLWDSDGIVYGSLQCIKQSENPINEQLNHESPEKLQIKKAMVTKAKIKEIQLPVSEDVKTSSNKITDENNEKKEISPVTEASKKDESDKSINKDEAQNVNSIIELHIHKIEQQLLLLAKTEDIEKTQSILKKYSEENSSILNDIIIKLNYLQEYASSIPVIPDKQIDISSILKNKFYLLAIGCLIVGFILGALIF